MRNIIEKYFPEMGIDISWYSKKKITPNIPEKDNLDNLDILVKKCKKCNLYKTRNNTVFGEGSHNSDIMIIGEAPGKEEDDSGKPFIGRAGKLLTEFLKSISLDRRSVFITNTVKCRPPENRNPEMTEIKSCSDYLDQQIAFIKPRVLVLLGKIAANRMLGEDKPISELRLKKFFVEKYDIPLIVFYHPAYILRSPLQKKKVWDDLQYLKTIIGSHGS
ncbi:MAG: uracil-DNA glycosylase [Gammaproteobacteria bacterium]|jgi:uracil-DNA glycosylase|nr:uracil-DNA glycosylase [Gammaproteobacteria bacterium]MBT4462778.1 uracil-DNA glycosylase [Gammaproteobacteria bacterium]MBT4654346.1 uracil-DNA glycosylase [Gammaproteobacteria bacterium]MBT5117334.1 uracil-DNA glycosylase [Gammaproteobacteria bacterium]MBT5761905.1 uracil-DNA glycosylase [Gammaproteobacteria bacterium]